MACVLCGKTQRLLNVDSVIYDSKNSLPEVLATAIGNKVTSEDWNNGNKHICLTCNRKCKVFDELHVRVQDLKDHLLQEYTKRIYRETKNKIANNVSNESDKTDQIGDDSNKTQNVEHTIVDGKTNENVGKSVDDGNEMDSIIHSDDDRKRKENFEFPDDDRKRKQNVDHFDDDGMRTESTDHSDEGDKRQSSDKDGEKDTDDAEKQNEAGDKGSSDRPVNAETVLPTLTITIKNETEDDSDDYGSPEHDVGSPKNLPDGIWPTSIVQPNNGVTRLVEKDDLRRLPDYEYRQWYTLHGYCLVLHTENNRGRLLTCASPGCGVCCRVTQQSELVKVRGAHTHEPDPRLPERNKLYAKLKERCMNEPATPLMTIYEEEAQKFPGGASCLPFPEVRMREWRAAKDPTVVIHTNTSTLDEVSKKYQCEVCNMGFNSSRLLIRHAAKHDQSKTTGRKKMSGAIAFVACSEMTAEKKKLRSTLEKTLNRVKSKIKAEESANETETEVSSKECHVCHETFTTLSELKEHILSAHREVLMCVHCDVAFDTPLLLRRHKTSCRKCCDERIMKRHLQNVEEDQLARELGVTTGQMPSEDIDMDPDDPEWDDGANKADESTGEEDEDAVPRKKKRDSESQNKPQKCQVCEKVFPTYQQLQTHLYTHASRKKYECTICGETYNKKAVLTRHMRAENHHGRVKLNPPRIDLTYGAARGVRCAWEGSRFECAVCGASFPRQAALLSHMREQKHITDQIIIHEAQQITRPPAEPPRNVKSHLTSRNRKHFMESDERCDDVSGGVLRAWHSVSGKRPFECAVCGAGFQHKIRLFAHMENEGHLTDSIVENVPMLQEITAFVEPSEENQIVPHDINEEPVQIKQESRVEILSQVIIQPNEVDPKQELPDEDDNSEEQAFYIQAAENADGDTVMVIQGDLEGAITENMQLYMDEEGNVVTQDADGNTVQVMQVLSRVHQIQNGDEQQEFVQALVDDPGAGLFVDGSGQVDEHGSRQVHEQEIRDQYVAPQPSEHIESNDMQKVEDDAENGIAMGSEDSEMNMDYSQTYTQSSTTAEELTETNKKLRECYEEIMETNDKRTVINDETRVEKAKSSETKLEVETKDEVSLTNEEPINTKDEQSEESLQPTERNADSSQTNAETTERNTETTEINSETIESNTETTETNAEMTETNALMTEINDETSEANEETTETKAEAVNKTPKQKSEPTPRTAQSTPRMTTRHVSKVESQKAVETKITTRLRSAKK